LLIIVAEIMNQDVPQAKGLLNAFKERAAQRKGRPSIETLTVGKGPAGGASLSGKSKKRPRERGNIVTINRSPGVMPTPPPPR